MAENEFFREVEEEYRRDQLANIWKRYSGLFVALALVVVAAVGGWRYWQYQERTRAETASARYEDALRLSRDGKSDEA
ncbi:MAG TPA: tetratricopeptide repeat protein, partial [Beijerinckiaceae bacterium]|nr:tetratricopeptide repeat protein [Beijerinckiaceae bacterium]